MYVSIRNLPLGRRDNGRTDPRSRQATPRIVVLLGLTSLFTDISAEMLTAVLPLFLVLGLGLSPAQFGLVDGLYRGVSLISTLGAGVLSDRLGRPKLVASAGYALSAATRPLLLVVSTAVGVAGLISADRIGKGIRTSPRDAMIAGASRPEDLGWNFGVHRALDTIGAMLGPLLAFGILLLLPGDYDAVFVVSSAFAFLGLAVLVLLVPAREPVAGGAEVAPALVAPPPRLTGADLRALLRSRPFTRRVGVAGLLTVFTVSDAFVFLALLERNEALARLFPLLAVGLAVAYTVFALPVGRLADRWGRMHVYLAGHVALLAVYAVVVGSLGTVTTTVLALLLLGLYYAATEGVLAAAVSATLPDVARASGLSLASTVVALAAFVSSLGFGVLSGRVGTHAAYLLMGSGLALVVGAAATAMRRTPTSGAGR